MGLAAVLTKEMLPVIQVLPESLCRIYTRAEFKLGNSRVYLPRCLGGMK